MIGANPSLLFSTKNAIHHPGLPVHGHSSMHHWKDISGKTAWECPLRIGFRENLIHTQHFAAAKNLNYLNNHCQGHGEAFRSLPGVLQSAHFTAGQYLQSGSAVPLPLHTGGLELSAKQSVWVSFSKFVRLLCVGTVLMPQVREFKYLWKFNENCFQSTSKTNKHFTQWLTRWVLGDEK